MRIVWHNATQGPQGKQISAKCSHRAGICRLDRGRRGTLYNARLSLAEKRVLTRGQDSRLPMEAMNLLN